jgi:DNA-binding response OmpR family regulator
MGFAQVGQLFAKALGFGVFHHGNASVGCGGCSVQDDGRHAEQTVEWTLFGVDELHSTVGDDGETAYQNTAAQHEVVLAFGVPPCFPSPPTYPPPPDVERARDDQDDDYCGRRDVGSARGHEQSENCEKGDAAETPDNASFSSNGFEILRHEPSMGCISIRPAHFLQPAATFEPYSGRMSTQTVVLIEDDELIASAVRDRLVSEGFQVFVAHDGLRGVQVCQAHDPDIVVLDVMLPGIDGLEVCRQIQQTRAVPVLMLTARSEEADMLLGLAVGADDYMTKPFSPRELVARIRTILRRVERVKAGAGTIRVGEVEIDEGRRIVRSGDETVHLTPTEFDLLVALANKRGDVISRDDLLRNVWGYFDSAGERTVDSHVRSVRRKLGDDVIRTVHGVGYAIGGGST